MNRRTFLRGMAGGAAGLAILQSSSSAWSTQANRKLNVALVGVGGRGTWFVDTIPKMENVVALCDVNQQKIDKAIERRADGSYPAGAKAKAYHDFRKMFDEMAPAKGEKKWADWAGHLIVGAKGKICATAHNATFTLIPEGDFKDVKRDAPQKTDASRGHEADWLLACRGGKPAWANFDYAGALTEMNMLGNVATQFEGKLEFDPAACKIVNNAEADAMLRPAYREGWSL